MARFYKIVVGSETATPPGGGAPSGNQGATFTNQIQGPNGPMCDLGAPQVELEITAYQADNPLGGSFVRIWGVSIQQIAQASDFNGAPISVYAGMQNGLPLATADTSQAGLIAQGYVQQAYGN